MTGSQRFNFLNEVVNNGLAPVHPDIQELDLYASMLDEVIANHKPNIRYFLLMPRATNADGTKFIYETEDGMGEWIMEGATVEVLDGGQVIGFRSAFEFEYHQDYNGVQHVWRMIQLSLHQSPHQDAQQNNATLSFIVFDHLLYFEFLVPALPTKMLNFRP
ncbi:hypothetical protein CTI12_AA084580 [Artemisia annua]|uniref:NAC domain-containing protein n=1 Tax=Artemisia annua TaxID=35608 RepID=A0A2U1Q2E6_ARTAN|nr:hypothetical protein CTI12_AA084580 [Artemisia annua]